MRSKGGTVEDYKGQRLFTYKDVGPTGASMGVALTLPRARAWWRWAPIRPSARPSTCAPGATASVTANEDLMRLVKEANAGGNAWVVAKFDALVDGRPGAERHAAAPAGHQLGHASPVTSTAASAPRVRAETRDEAAAKNLRDVLQGILALAKLQTGQRADLAAIVNSIELGGEGKNVSLGLLGSHRSDRSARSPGRGARRRRSRRTRCPAAPEAEPVPAP